MLQKLLNKLFRKDNVKFDFTYCIRVIDGLFYVTRNEEQFLVGHSINDIKLKFYDDVETKTLSKKSWDITGDKKLKKELLRGVLDYIEYEGKVREDNFVCSLLK
jgi:hypothetical protein